MKIEITDIAFFYNLLTKPFVRSDDGEGWKEDNPEVSRRLTFGMRIGPVLMPPPFTRTILFLERAGLNYNASLNFEAAPGTDYSRFSERMSKLYGKGWIPINPQQGHGYLLIGEGKTPPSLVVYGKVTDKLSDQYIAIGSFGAAALRLGDFDSFMGDFGLLEKIANVYCDSVIPGNNDGRLADLVVPIHSAT